MKSTAIRPKGGGHYDGLRRTCPMCWTWTRWTNCRRCRSCRNTFHGPMRHTQGRMVYLFENKDGDADAKPIADFTASIVEEIVDEHGNSHPSHRKAVGLRRVFRCGNQRTGLPVSDVRLLAAARRPPQAGSTPYNAMSPHLRPPSASRTAVEDQPQRIRYYRTGWQDDSYLSPDARHGQHHAHQRTPPDCPRGAQSAGELNSGC